MAVDSATTIAGFDIAQPPNSGTNGKRFEGAANIRHIKTVLQGNLGNIDGAVTATDADLNLIAGIAAASRKVINFASGTACLFYQDTAPTGWTITQSVDEHAVRLTKGSAAGGATAGTAGGTHDFSTQFASLAEGATPGVGSHTLTGAESGTSAHTHPSHTHNCLVSWDSGALLRGTLGVEEATGRGTTPTYDLDENLGQAYLQSTVTPASSAANASSGHSHTVDLRVKWAACIIATLD